MKHMRFVRSVVLVVPRDRDPDAINLIDAAQAGAVVLDGLTFELTSLVQTPKSYTLNLRRPK